MKEQVVYIDVDKLHENPRNARKNDNAVDTVAKSIERYGFRNPLIVDSDYVVWCGNTRLKASRKLGLKEVPCIIVNDLTPKQLEELAIVDNKSNEIAEWDADVLSTIVPELDLSAFEFDWEWSYNKDNNVERADIDVNIGTIYELSVNCENEKELELLYNELTSRGYECKISTL